MARKASGREVLEHAKKSLLKVKTAQELRIAQAVIFPLEFGLSLEQTAIALGVSVGWVCRLRRQFIQKVSDNKEGFKKQHGGRRRENMTLQEEKLFLEPFIETAKIGGILVVSEIKLALEEKLGRKVVLASVYNLLHRNDWRKLVPDKQHPKANPPAREEWKKNSRSSLKK